MSYYFNKTLKGVNFEKAIESVTAALKGQGFGILTEIDMKKTLHEKLGVDINKYKILGACNPDFAYQALTHEAHIGLLLPCNLLVRELDNDTIEVSIINPTVAMSVVEDDNLQDMAIVVQDKLQQVMAKI